MRARHHADVDQLGARRWRGEAGRTEIWYATFTDARTGTGGWIHCEAVAPVGGAGAHGHGWIGLFPADSAPVVERFGPAPLDAASDERWFGAAGVVVGPGCLRGSTPTMSWDLSFHDTSAPLFTFPRTVWERQLLPAAQIVPWPEAQLSGVLTVAGATTEITATGAVARIYGHGNAERWGWLHALLDGGGVLEIVTATARRRSMRRLPPLAMVQLRLPDERDWPANPALACVRFRTRLRADGFSVRGRAGGRRLEVDVTLPVDRRVALAYTDPDGSPATCTNSERAAADITLDGRGGRRRWFVDGTAHAEVGSRP